MPALAQQNPDASARTQSSLVRIAEAWRRSPDSRRAGRFIQYLRNFLQGLTNEHTARSYRYAIEEFWDWYESTYGRLPTPDRIERRDAQRYADWLRTRQTGLAEHRLARDPDRRLDHAIYETVKHAPGVHIAEIRRRLAGRSEFVTTLPGGGRVLTIEKDNPSGLDRRLACLVEEKLLARSPTVEELRRRDPTLYGRLGERLDPDLFAYSIAEATAARGAERASAMATRLAALSALWTYWISETGENTGAEQALLEHNIWQVPLAAAVELAPSHKAAARAKKTPGIETFQKLLATTYVMEDGTPTPSSAFEDVRDRAALLVFLWTGLRAEELGSLRRGDVAGDPPVVTVVGKGGRARSFALPEPAVAALDELRRKIAELANAAERRSQGTTSRMSRLLEDSAPLLPAIARWGCNAYSPRAQEERGLSRQAFAMMLRRRAIQAGIAPGSDEFARVHPHGLRHLASLTAVEAGVPVRVVQAVLGHQSLGTTGQYVEARDPRHVSLFVAPPSPPARARPPVRRPEIIETTGVPVVLPVMPPPAAPAPPPALIPKEERLVAIGRQTPPKRPIPSEQELSGLTVTELPSTAALDQIYTAPRWGESTKAGGSRQPLHAEKMSAGDVEARDDLLVQTYVSRASGLVWWAGPSGKLKPEMPVMAPLQLVDDPGPYGSIRQGLEDLWTRWSSGEEPDRGPTAAAALLAWLREALGVMEQTDMERESRGGAWVPYDSPIGLTYFVDDRAKNFRMHREDMIVLWFRLRAYTYMQARGRGGEKARVGRAVDDTAAGFRPKDPRVQMPWYDEPDPLASLSAGDRTDLIDWLYALTGRAPPDRQKRFPRGPGEKTPALSRWEVAGLIGLLCAYDTAEDDLKDAKRAVRHGTAREQDVRRAQKALAEAEMMVHAQARTLTRGRDVDIKALVAERVKKTRSGLKHGDPNEEAATDKADRRRDLRRHFYMRTIGELIGPEAADDEALGLFALCQGAPLRGSMPAAGDYRDLFTYDPGRQTIVHKPDFQVRFARDTGAHSECVARRIARLLWELKKAGAVRFDPRSAELAGSSLARELAEQLDTWVFYKVPCPAPLEAELRSRLGGAPPLQLLATWDAHRQEEVEKGTSLSTPRERRLARARIEELEARRGETPSVFEAPLQEEFGRNAAPHVKRYLANARQHIPNPVVLVSWLGLR